MKVWRYLSAMRRTLTTSASSILLVASGGLGLLPELGVLIMARAAGRNGLVTHHSSGYVRRSSKVMHLLCAVGSGRTLHVLLSEGMRQAFHQRYGVPLARCLVLSNIALVEPPRGGASGAGLSESGEEAVNVLHLSNLSVEKGTLVVIEVAARLAHSHPQLRFNLAGPLPISLRKPLRDAQAAGARIDHLGPLTGAPKESALRSADVFLFPSRYVHEAQPLVLYEAARYGALLMAWDVGWVREQASQLGRDHVVLDQGDVAGFLAHLKWYGSLPPAERAALRAGIREQWTAAHARSLDRLEVLLRLMNLVPAGSSG